MSKAPSIKDSIEKAEKQARAGAKADEPLCPSPNPNLYMRITHSDPNASD